MSNENAKIVELFGFEKNEKAKPIELSLLSESIRVEDNLGREYKTRPIQAWALLSMIAEMLKEANVAFKAHPIMVREDSSGVALNDEDKARYSKTLCPINKWYFDQLITKIDIPHIGGDLANGTIAIAYTKRGISVAFGLNISICDNLCIMGGQQLRTYKFDNDRAFNWEGMRNTLRTWIGELNQRLGVEAQIMQRMQEREISNTDAVDQFIGKLYQAAVYWRYFNGPQAPYDITGMSNFVQEMFKRRREENLNNVWDLYMWGTSIIKPDIERIENIIESSRILANFLCSEFGVEREDLIQEVQIVED